MKEAQGKLGLWISELNSCQAPWKTKERGAEGRRREGGKEGREGKELTGDVWYGCST